MNSRFIKSRVRSLTQDLCQIFVRCFTCFILKKNVNLLYLFCFFPHFSVSSILLKTQCTTCSDMPSFQQINPVFLWGRRGGGVLLVTKFLKIPFKIGIFLSCLLRLDPWIWCLFSYWMSHRSVLGFLKSKQKEMGGNSRLHLWKQNGEILFFRKMSPEI